MGQTERGSRVVPPGLEVPDCVCAGNSRSLSPSIPGGAFSCLHALKSTAPLQLGQPYAKKLSGETQQRHVLAETSQLQGLIFFLFWAN